MPDPKEPASGPSLLLVSDDLLFPSRIREAARPLGLSVKVASSEASARERIAACRPAAILVNLNARRFTPDAVIRSLKAGPDTAGIPLLAFAGHVETQKHAAARAAGADMTAANSSVSLHLGRLLERLASGERSGDVAEISE